MFRRILFVNKLGNQSQNAKCFGSGRFTSSKKDESNTSQESLQNDDDRSSFRDRFSITRTSSVDLLHFLQKIDFSLPGIKKYIKDSYRSSRIIDQLYDSDRVAVLGIELAAAHFIVCRRGKIRFQGKSEWIHYEDRYDTKKLPNLNEADYIVEDIEFGLGEFVYQGIECISNLKHVRSISFAHSPTFDDWMMDAIVGNFWETLEHLDVSYCTNLSERGIACIARIRNLKSLNLEGLDHVKNLKYLRFLLEDSIPGLIVKGYELESGDPKSIVSGDIALPKDKMEQTIGSLR